MGAPSACVQTLYSQEGDPVKEVIMKCNTVYRAQLHPSIVMGGVSIGECDKECIPGFVVCFEHVNKEALTMMLRSERRVIAEQNQEISRLQGNVRRLKYKSKTPRQAVKAVREAVEELEVSPVVKKILNQIVGELDSAWMAHFKKLGLKQPRRNK